MSDLAGRLKTILTTLIQLHQRLLPLFEQEKEAGLARKPEELEKIAAEIESVLADIRRIDGERRQVVGAMGRKLGIADPEPTLTQVQEAMGGDTALGALRDRLKGAIIAADDANRSNKAALEGVMQASQFLLQAFSRAAGGGDISYSRSGKRSGREIPLFSKRL